MPRTDCFLCNSTDDIWRGLCGPCTMTVGVWQTNLEANGVSGFKVAFRSDGFDVKPYDPIDDEYMPEAMEAS